MPCILNFFVIVSFLYTVAPVLFSRSKWKCIATMARLASYLLYRFFLKRKSQVYLYCSLLLVNTTKTAQSSLYFVENFYACVCYFNLLDSTSDLKKELPSRTVAIHKRFRVLFSFVSILHIPYKQIVFRLVGCQLCSRKQILPILCIGCGYSTFFLSPFSPNPTCQLHVLGHDGHSFGMNGTQIGIFKESHQKGLGSFLQGQDGIGLKS